MKTKRSPRRPAKSRRGGTLPHGAVQLGLERLEERAFLAGDVDFQNPANRFDVNNDGVFNRFDIFSLVSDLRLFGERTLTAGSGTSTAPSGGEGEAPAGGLFVDVNGDGDLDRRDVFGLIGQFRAEGEAPPVDANDIIEYTFGVFQDLGNGQVRELTSLVDGSAANSAIAVPQNSELILRVFIQDLGVGIDNTDPGNPNRIVPRDPTELGVATYSLDVGYTESVGTALNKFAANVADAADDSPASFVGTTGLPGNDFATPSGTPVTPIYDDAFNAGDDFPNVGGGGVIHHIKGQTNTLPPPFVGGGRVIAFDIPFISGPTSSPAIPFPLITFATQFFTLPGVGGGTFFTATQDDAMRSDEGIEGGVVVDRDPATTDTFNLVEQVVDAFVELAVVDNIAANPDNLVLFELPAPNTPLVAPVTAVTPAVAPTTVTIDVTANDFVTVGAGNLKGVSDNGVSNFLPAQGTAAVNDNGTTAAPPTDFLADDKVDYTPNAAFFVGTDAFTYTLDELNAAGDATTGNNRQGTVSLDFREFNFPPVPSAPGIDETALGVAARTVDQGATLQILESILISNAAGQDTDGDYALDGVTPVDTSSPIEESGAGAPARGVRIPANIAPGTVFRVLLKDSTPVVPTLTDAPEAGTLESNANGDLIFRSNPAFVLPSANHSLVLEYQVEDFGNFEADLAAAPGSPLAENNKRATQTLDIILNDVPDLVEFTVEYFANGGGGALGANLDPGTGAEVGINTQFFAQVSVEVTAAGLLANATGVQTALSDLRFDPVLIEFDTGVAATDITVIAEFAGAAVNEAFFGTNLVDNTGGSEAVVVPNATTAAQEVYRVLLQTLAPTVSTVTNLATLFADSQGAAGILPEDVVINLAGGGTLSLSAAQVGFKSKDLLVAVGQKPIAVDDPYTFTEDQSQTISELQANPAPPPALVPVPFTGTPSAFSQTRGVLFNDSDLADVSATNLLVAELVAFTVNPAFGVLELEDTATGNFIPIGTGAAVAGFQWNGGFRFTVVPNVSHGIADPSEFFTYRVLDPNGRRSDIGTATLRIVADPDAPIAVDDIDATGVKYEVARNATLNITDAGNITGAGGPQAPANTKGILNNDVDVDPGTVLKAQLLSVPSAALGQLSVLYETAPGVFTAFPVNSVADFNLVELAQGPWRGIFRFQAANNRGVASFEYQAVDNDNLASVRKRADIEVGLANVTVAGQLYVDDSNVNRLGELSTGTGGNGQFGFDDANQNNVWDVGEQNIERTLGGVDMTLGPDLSRLFPDPQGPILPGVPFSTVSVVTDARGQFNMATQANGGAIPAGNYTLTADERLALFFSTAPVVGGLDAPVPTGAAPLTVEESVAANDAIFRELGLKLEFLNFHEMLASNLRDGIYIGYDDTPGNTDPIVWYTMDRGPGWSVFDHRITNLTFVGGNAVLEFSRPDLANPGSNVSVNIAIPAIEGANYSEVRQGNLRVIHIMGTAAALETLYRV